MVANSPSRCQGKRRVKEVALILASLAQRVDHHRQPPVGTGAHVLRSAARPRRCDPNHGAGQPIDATTESSRNQAVHAAAKADSKYTDSRAAPPDSST